MLIAMSFQIFGYVLVAVMAGAFTYKWFVAKAYTMSKETSRRLDELSKETSAKLEEFEARREREATDYGEVDASIQEAILNIAMGIDDVVDIVDGEAQAKLSRISIDAWDLYCCAEGDDEWDE